MINGHGGNIYDTAKRLGCSPSDMIDMSSNVNPLGPPPGLSDFLIKNMLAITALPEADAKSISAAFAKRYGVDPRLVLGGNGTTEFIYTIPRALGIKKGMILGPTYADYADACTMNHVPYAYVIADEVTDFKPDIRQVGDILSIKKKGLFEGIDTVFICNPNNPTGVLIPGDELRELCEYHPNINFIIDESYLPFVKDGDKESMMNCGFSNVIILHSMSKIFRIPGLRIGFLVSSETIIEKLRRYTLPWNINGLAQAGVRYLMEQKRETDTFIKETQRFLEKEKETLFEKLSPIDGMKLFPSVTSFLLAQVPGFYTADQVCEYLLNDRILIRNCANFKGLSDRFIRISLKTEEPNQLLVKRLLDFFRNQ